MEQNRVCKKKTKETTAVWGGRVDIGNHVKIKEKKNFQ